MHYDLFHIAFYDLICLGTLYTGLTLIVLSLWLESAERAANRLLCLALGVALLRTAVFPPVILLALGPLLYFYTRALTRPDRHFHWKQLLYFTPLLPGLWLPAWLIPVSIIPYLWISFRLLREYLRQQPPVLMDRPQHAFRQLRNELLLFGVLAIFCVFNAYFCLGYALVLIAMVAQGLVKQRFSAHSPEPRYPDANLRAQSRQLKATIVAGRLYEDPELTLTSLADILSMHPNDLSWLINRGLKKSFNDFISELRVREVIRKMQDPAYDRLTLLGIAYNSGFNSKTTFNRVFKAATGKRPTDYKKEIPTYKMAPLPAVRQIILRPGTPPEWAAEPVKRNIMIRNYFKMAWRSLLKNKISSFINLSGLSVGMAAAMLIGLWIYDELTYNQSYDHYRSIAQVMVHANYDGTISTISSNPMPLATELRSTYAGDFKKVVMSTGAQQKRIGSGDKEFDETGRYMEPAVGDLLTLKMRHGWRAGLYSPGSILLSESLAAKLFGATDPVGKLVSIDKKQSATVKGVYEDQPGNSEFKDLAFIAPFDLFLSANDWARKAQADWGSQFVQIYIQLNDHVDMAQVSDKIKNSKLTHISGDQVARKPIVFLQPMSRWHLYNTFQNGVNVKSDALKYVWFYGVIGLFILLLACINFMNLSTARSEKRAKEVGIRKVIGSGRGRLIAQFYTESVLLAFLGYIAAVGLVALSLPWFNGVADKIMHIPWANPLFWLSGIAFALFTGFMAGSYPALYLSAFQPIKALKGAFRSPRMAALPRQVLVVLQFTVSIVLIVGTIVVYRQLRFAQNRPIGYSREGIITVALAGDMQAKYPVLNNELKASRAVTAIAESASPLTSIWSTSTDIDWPGKSPGLKEEFSTIPISSDYGKTISWQFLSGRDFNAAGTGDSSSFVINETAARAMGLRNPVGALVKYAGSRYRIIGIVKDMVMESPFKPISPTLFFLKGDRNCLFIRLNPSMSTQASLAKVLEVFKQVAPDVPLDYQFVDDAYAAKFTAEVRIGNLAKCFAGLAILISCLGLFGMASFMAEQRIKETGIRKILGATVISLWYAQCLGFVKLVLLAFLVAVPLSWYFMHNWLNDYTYRIPLSWWIFAAAGLGAVFIALITVSYQALRSAVINPVKSLRNE